MKRLPNGLTVFNATPHVIRFWHKSWDHPVEVKPDEIISAEVEEKRTGALPCPVCGRTGHHEYDCWNRMSPDGDIQLVSTVFSPTAEGRAVIRQAQQAGADVIVGSIIAAQSYPEQVVAMTPAPGYERVPPSEKRMNPHKFTIF